jgi:hypothetical protein
MNLPTACGGVLDPTANKNMFFKPGARALPAVFAPAACANSPAPAADLSLDDGLAQIAAALETGLPEKTRIAVVNFESPSARFSDYVLEELQGLLVNHAALAAKRKQPFYVQRSVHYIYFLFLLLFQSLKDFLCPHKTFLCFSRSLPMLSPIYHSSKYTSSGFAILKG